MIAKLNNLTFTITKTLNMLLQKYFGKYASFNNCYGMNLKE